MENYISGRRRIEGVRIEYMERKMNKENDWNNNMWKEMEYKVQ